MTKRKYRNREDWKALIETQLKSGLSAAEFCHDGEYSGFLESVLRSSCTHLKHLINDLIDY